MGRSSYAAQVGAQLWRNVRSHHEIDKISPVLGSAKCLGLIVTHPMPKPHCGQVIFLSCLTMAP